jgi:hypothetical protein
LVTAGERSHRADRGDQLLRRVVLEHEAAGAGAERLEDVLVEIEGREDQDLRGRVGGEDPPSGLEAVELGHPDVHQHDGRVEAGRFGDRVDAVVGLGDHVDVLLAGEEHPEAGPHHRLVVDDEDADARRAHRTPPASGRRVWSTKPPPLTLPALISPP